MIMWCVLFAFEFKKCEQRPLGVGGVAASSVPGIGMFPLINLLSLQGGRIWKAVGTVLFFFN